MGRHRGRPVATSNMKRGQAPGVSLAYYRPVLEGSLAEEAKQEKKRIRITASEHAHNTATSRVENALRRTLSDPTYSTQAESVKSYRAALELSWQTSLTPRASAPAHNRCNFPLESVIALLPSIVCEVC